jgi:uncharacterized protein YdcH (DUF465 family)
MNDRLYRLQLKLGEAYGRFMAAKKPEHRQRIFDDIEALTDMICEDEHTLERVKNGARKNLKKYRGML